MFFLWDVRSNWSFLDSEKKKSALNFIDRKIITRIVNTCASSALLKTEVRATHLSVVWCLTISVPLFCCEHTGNIVLFKIFWDKD
jgi:hypothetical protein